MRRRIAVSSLLGIVLAVSLSVAAAKADFGGTWVMDKSRSEGLPADMKQTMTVKQDGDRIEVMTRIESKEDTQTISDSYIVNGQKKEFVPQGPNGMKGRGVRTIGWLDEGKVLEIDEESTFDTPQGPLSGRITRHWSLSDDGMTLTIESSFKGPRGENRTKRIFVRKRSA